MIKAQSFARLEPDQKVCIELLNQIGMKFSKTSLFVLGSASLLTFRSSRGRDQLGSGQREGTKRNEKHFFLPFFKDGPFPASFSLLSSLLFNSQLVDKTL